MCSILNRNKEIFGKAVRQPVRCKIIIKHPWWNSTLKKGMCFRTEVFKPRKLLWCYSRNNAHGLISLDEIFDGPRLQFAAVNIFTNFITNFEYLTIYSFAFAAIMRL